jgi:hypothetical protein
MKQLGKKRKYEYKYTPYYMILNLILQCYVGIIFVHHAILMYLRHARKKRTDERPFFRTDVWGCPSAHAMRGVVGAALNIQINPD